MGPRPQKIADCNIFGPRGAKWPRGPEAPAVQEAAWQGQSDGQEYDPYCDTVEEYVPQGDDGGESWWHLASECRDPDCSFLTVRVPSDDEEEEGEAAGASGSGCRWREAAAACGPDEEHVQQEVPAWRRWEYRTDWADVGVQDYEPWGHPASECRNPHCPFTEVELPSDEDDEDAELDPCSGWRRWGHLESECGGGCGCVPVLLPAGCREAQSATDPSCRYQWPGLAFQRKTGDS